MRFCKTNAVLCHRERLFMWMALFWSDQTIANGWIYITRNHRVHRNLQPHPEENLNWNSIWWNENISRRLEYSLLNETIYVQCKYTYLRHKIGTIETSSSWINTWQLMLVVIHEFNGSFFEQCRCLFFVKRWHFIASIFFCWTQRKQQH